MSKVLPQRYPFIKGEFYRGSGNQLVVRTMMEHKTGRLAADVISVGTENVMALKRSGIWTRYRSPEAQNYPREQFDKDGFFHADSLGLATIAYNTQLVKKEEAPKGYNDLLDRQMEEQRHHRFGARAHPLDLAFGVGRSENPRLRAKTARQWRHGASRSHAAGAASLRRRIQSRRGNLSRWHPADEAEGLPGFDRFSQIRRRRWPAATTALTSMRRIPTPPHCSSILSCRRRARRFFRPPAGCRSAEGARSVYEELSNLEEKGVNLHIVTAEQTDQLSKAMEKIMKEMLVR